MLLCAVVMLLSGCASGITRTGYVLPKNPPPGSPQRGPIALQCKAKFDRNAVISLGSIHAYDTGFSMDCDEAYVLDIFCNEGRLLGADLVNITEEHQPNILTHLPQFDRRQKFFSGRWRINPQ